MLLLIWEEQTLNIYDYGLVPNTENLPGIPARVTAVHKERYEIVCAHGLTHAWLKPYVRPAAPGPLTNELTLV